MGKSAGAGRLYRKHLESKGLDYQKFPEYPGPPIIPTNETVLAIFGLADTPVLARRNLLYLMGHRNEEADETLMPLTSFERQVRQAKKRRTTRLAPEDRCDFLNTPFTFVPDVPLGNDFFYQPEPCQIIQMHKSSKLARRRELYYKKKYYDVVKELRVLHTTCRNDRKRFAFLEKKITQLKSTSTSLRRELTDLRERNQFLEDKNLELHFDNQRVGELENEVEMAKEDVEALRSDIVIIKDQSHYTEEARACVAKLKRCNVPDTKIAEALEAVAELCGKTLNALPSSKTVASFRKQAAASAPAPTGNTPVPFPIETTPVPDPATEESQVIGEIPVEV